MGYASDMAAALEDMRRWDERPRHLRVGEFLAAVAPRAVCRRCEAHGVRRRAFARELCEPHYLADRAGRLEGLCCEPGCCGGIFARRRCRPCYRLWLKARPLRCATCRRPFRPAPSERHVPRECSSCRPRRWKGRQCSDCPRQDARRALEGRPLCWRCWRVAWRRVAPLCACGKPLNGPQARACPTCLRRAWVREHPERARAASRRHQRRKYERLKASDPVGYAAKLAASAAGHARRRQAAALERRREVA